MKLSNKKCKYCGKEAKQLYGDGLCAKCRKKCLKEGNKQMGKTHIQKIILEILHFDIENFRASTKSDLWSYFIIPLHEAIRRKMP